MKYVINVPEDVYTISAGSYRLFGSIRKNIKYNKETNTSENFLKKLVNSIQVNTNYFKEDTYINQNYYTYNFIDSSTPNIISLISNTKVMSHNNHWMYPLENMYRHINTYNFPITRTISIIINSNTLPVYTIPEITVDLEYSGSKKQLIIPEGSYTYSSFNNVFYNYFKNIYYTTDKFTNFFSIPYFEYTRYILPNSNIIIRNNSELNKYYGLLHMIYTIPDSVNFDTNINSYKFPCNAAPVYRSLHIPEGTYTANELVDYINTNSSYSYNLNGIPSLSYTQFLAKVVDNDVVIYTNDNTEFFINPICKLNQYKESNWSNEHKLCALEEELLYDIKPQYYIGQSVYLVPKYDYTNFSATNLPDGLTIDANSGVISGIISTENLYKKYNIVVTSGIISANVNMNIIKKNRTILKNNKYDYIIITK